MALTASKGWDDLGTSWRQFCFQQLTTDLSRDPGDMRLGRVHDRQRVLGGRDRAGLGDPAPSRAASEAARR